MRWNDLKARTVSAQSGSTVLSTQWLHIGLTASYLKLSHWLAQSTQWLHTDLTVIYLKSSHWLAKILLNGYTLVFQTVTQTIPLVSTEHTQCVHFGLTASYFKSSHWLAHSLPNGYTLVLQLVTSNCLTYQHSANSRATHWCHSPSLQTIQLVHIYSPTVTHWSYSTLLQTPPPHPPGQQIYILEPFIQRVYYSILALHVVDMLLRWGNWVSYTMQD